MNDPNEKKLMDGYVGVKFHAIQRSEDLPPMVSDLYKIFKNVCSRLRDSNMTYANAGNISMRYRDGFIISSSGCNLGCIEKEELVFVEECDDESNTVIYHGPLKPSSEAIMHWLIYVNRPEAKAIIHAHDEFATQPELLKDHVDASEREESYGTVELAHMAIETFKKDRLIIVLKNHGYVAIGDTLELACNLIIDTRNRLLENGG